MGEVITRIAVILGPTACGKTAASILAAKTLGAEIVSADSIQVYQELDIGSAKPTAEEMQGVCHHMLSVVPVTEAGYSVAAYREAAAECIANIKAKGRLPMVVGGTGLYINAFTYPLQFTQVPGDPNVRQALIQEDQASPDVLYQRLQKIDPVTTKRLHPNDKKRIIRALEVYTVSGRALSSYGNDFSNRAGGETPYDAVQIGLTMPRELLYQRIEQRVDRMMEQGLYAETERLYQAGYSRSLPAMQGLGYKQLLNYFYGECTLEEAVAAIKQETRRFAKRQITWFKRDQRIHWLDVTAFKDTASLAEQIVSTIQER